MAWVPYLLLVVFVLAWGDADIKLRINTFTHNLLPAWVPSAPGQLNRLAGARACTTSSRRCRR